ncbi:anillin isoform X1 [Pygocentrus nattereri]|uniref:anillin isoform X1 n=1 Tax=Pygocentrus nattereri TaxID=42514 RepID=UPI0008144F2E|nr:anillin isoform X1 [Pygocentrus nattereri]
MDNDGQSDKTHKRQREPLEENVLASNELENVLKRRRLVAEEVENQNPLQPLAGSPARSRRLELEVKPDTPAIASIRLRVQQLTQRRDGVAALVQRCMSDPGAESPSNSLLRDVCHIGEGEFTSRLERFKTPTPDSSPVPSTPSTRQLSSFVHNMQQQLNTTVTPSTKEATRIRQAREDELKLLRVQPLTENMWLKRSLSDSSLAERAVSPTSSTCVCKRTRKIPWPTLQFGKDDSNIDSKEAECSISFSGVNKVMGDSLNDTSAFTGDLQPCCTEFCLSESMMHPNEQMSTSALIDKMFEDVLQAADKEEEGEKGKETVNEESLSKRNKRENADMEVAETEQIEKSLVSSFGEDGMSKESAHCCAEWEEKDGVNSAEGQEIDEENVCSKREEEIKEESTPVPNEEDFLTLPPTCVLSPLSKSVEAVVTPLRLVATVPTPTVQCPSPEEVTTPSADSAPPLYSIDAYRSQRKNSHLASQCVTPGIQKQATEKSYIKPTINTKETIKVLSEEAARLQTVINQTLQALSCCSDEEHGKGSLQEAEAEKLLLVSSEKHAALLTEISRLREGAGAVLDSSTVSLQPCRGTVSISSVQLPLKVEFLCSARTGRPTHYFFILIRYGPCNIVATPLATAADAENGDTITFPTSITLQDIRSNFEIDIEVYSLSSNAGQTCTTNLQQLRSSTKSRVTPKKLLSSITKSNPGLTSGALPVLGSRRTSNFSLVGSHKITLASLGQSKFTLDKMKFEGKIRRLLGDEFQEKVPFLSPLEGHIYLRLHSESHSNVQHQGFLTMFEDISGFGAWQRLFFKLEGGFFFYWNHPNEMGDKPAEGSISLCGFDCVRHVERDSCARPHTFELVNTRTLQQDNSHILTKTWFSADTREERVDWIEKLSQVLLDLHTWCRQPSASETDQANTSNTAASRESIL